MFGVSNTGYDIVWAIKQHYKVIGKLFDAVIEIVQVEYITTAWLVQ